MKKNILIIVLLIVICCMGLEIYNINKKEVSNTIIEQNQSEKKDFSSIKLIETK